MSDHKTDLYHASRRTTDILRRVDTMLVESFGYGHMKNVIELIRDAAQDLNGASAGFAVAEELSGNPVHKRIFSEFISELTTYDHHDPDEAA